MGCGNLFSTIEDMFKHESENKCSVKSFPKVTETRGSDENILKTKESPDYEVIELNPDGQDMVKHNSAKNCQTKSMYEMTETQETNSKTLESANPEVNEMKTTTSKRK